MLRIALIFGGRSAEHEVSLASARFVADHLRGERYEVVPVGIDRDGAWVVPDDLDAALAGGLDACGRTPVALLPDPTRPGLETSDGRRIPLDFAFPMLHGTYGEDGTIQGLLEMADLPYAGAGVLASAVGMDKELMKAAFADHGLPQVEHLVERDGAADIDAAVARIEAAFDYPLFVKPANAGSSIGMTKVHDRSESGRGARARLSLRSQADRRALRRRQRGRMCGPRQHAP